MVPDLVPFCGWYVMSNSHLGLLLALLVSVSTLLAGCGSQESPEPEVELPDWLSETDTDTGDSPTTSPETETELGQSATPEAVPVSAEGTHNPVVHASAQRAGESLKPGEVFPLRKVVEQELHQSSLNGTPQISRSRLELNMALTVADVRDGHTLMQVQYDRIKYSQDLAGETTEYDSAQPPQSIPAAARAYHGMVGDGFSFWLGADNQVVQVSGFREFLDRCLAHIPAESRQQALLAFESSAGESGVTDFIDATVGLLPGDLQQVPGKSWETSRHITEPIPMQINTMYTLSSIDGRTAEVTIGGTIAPSTPLGGTQSDSSVQVTVNGGRCSGRCTIDRLWGLPRASQIERTVDMTVRMAGAVTFDQQKRTLTTIESLPTPSASATGPNDRPQFR